MADCKRKRCFSIVIVCLAVAAVVPMSGWVNADVLPGRTGAQPVLDLAGDMRRPAVRITGWVREVAPTYVWVGDYLLYLESGTPPTDLDVGMYVKATARQDEQGQLYAERFAILPTEGVTVPQGVQWPDQPPDSPVGFPFEFRGVIEEMDPRYWLVDQRMVFLTARTSVEGRPRIGSFAEVKGVLLYRDTVLAERIKITTGIEFPAVEFHGTIESMTDHTWIVNGTTVRIGPLTLVDGAPAVDAIAEVQGILQPDGSVLAERIRIQYPPHQAPIEVEGRVESIEAERWVIGEETVVINSGTLIDDSRAPAEVGMWALAQGLEYQGRSLVAVRIRLSRPD